MTPIETLQARMRAPDYLFTETLAFVAAHYHYQPRTFVNGPVTNPAGTNEGSCKTLGLALLEQFTQEQALLAFGEHYRSVQATPEGTDHGNIRALMAGGLAAVHFDELPLTRQS